MTERARDLCIQCEGKTIINQEICVEEETRPVKRGTAF